MSYQDNEFEKYKNQVLQFIRKRQQNPNSPSTNRTVWIVIAGIAIILAALNSFYTVEPDEVGVVTRFGHYEQTTQPGPHFKIPLVDKVYKVQSKRRQEEIFGYRENSRTGAKQRLQEESLMLTGDLNLADVQWMVQYEISDPWQYLFRVKDVPKTIRDVSMSVMRRVVGDRLVGEVLTTGRAEIAMEAERLMQGNLDEYNTGIRIVTVELQAVTPPEKVKPAFNDVNAAKQEQESAINRAEREYNRMIPRARGRAEQAIADAEAYAVRVVNQAKGDANRFTSLMQEYEKAPKITRERMYIETLEEVLSQIDRFTVVDKEAKGLLPVYGPISQSLSPETSPKNKASN